MNERYLMAISVGPVQDFIAAARKTRDLWYGSTMLSDVSRAVANSVQNQPGAELIFPHESAVATGSSDDAVPVANIILVRLSSPEKTPKEISDDARRAAEKLLQARHRTALAEIDGAVRAGLIDTDLFQAQVDSFLEFYSAWLPLPSDDAYGGARERLMLLLAGRKALREFNQPPPLTSEQFGRPKSMLDPSRESILDHEQERPHLHDDLRGRLKSETAEHLDGISMIKRVSSSERFASVSRVAVDPFIRRIKDDDEQGINDPWVLDTLISLADKLGDTNDVERFSSAFNPNLKQYEDFPFDTQLFYVDEHALSQEVKDSTELTNQARSFQRRVRALPYDPPAYYAVLVADGDRMGKIIGDMQEIELHRDFSSQLVAFAKRALKIVVEHRGLPIYTGGDDVLAFLPLDQAIECANALRRAFPDEVRTPEGIPDVTMSAGLAIGHYREPLYLMLARGRDAERRAKDAGRNRLAVALHTRSGGGDTLTVVHNWKKDEPAVRWARWVDWHRQDLFPRRAGYELRALAQLAETAPLDADAFAKELARLLKRKEPGGETIADEQIRTITDLANGSPANLRRLADELQIAHRLAAVDELANPRREPREEDSHG